MRNKNFEDIAKLIKNSPYLGVKNVEFSPTQCAIEFKDPKTAVLFALNFENYFPVAGEFVRITYDISYLCGIRSLAEHADHLKKRRVVYLVDVDGVSSLSTPFGAPLDTKHRSMAIENHLKKITASAVEKGTDPEELIVCYTSGWGGEDLYGALGGFSLRERGYVVFPDWTDYPFFVNMAGVPDLVAVKLGTFQDSLIENGVIEYGAWIVELELYEIFGKCTRKGRVEENEAVAAEVEPSKPRASGGRKQLRNYVSTGHFNQAILICPGRADDEKYEREFGYITWDDSNEERYYRPKITYHQDEKIAELLIASKRLASSILVKNMTLERLLRAYGNKSVFEILDAFIESPKMFSP
jgi:hypothetical protein